MMRQDNRGTEKSIAFYIQHYTCENGAIAKFMIPEDATVDDLKGFREILDIVIQRHFKYSGTCVNTEQDKTIEDIKAEINDKSLNIPDASEYVGMQKAIAIIEKHTEEHE